MKTNNLIVISSLLAVIFGHESKGFDDPVMCPMKNGDLVMEQPTEQKPLVVTSHNKEKYNCFKPRLQIKESETQTPYTGPGPLDLISTLFTSCSYRIESYWTYEVCHGNYIQQFHEEREGNTTKRQPEYFLGKWDKQKTDKLREDLAQAERAGEKFKYKKIDGLSLPYLEFEMTDGTWCDLINNQRRVTKVLYVCYASGKNEVYSLKEVSTCNYEVIILTPTLCAHPNFKPK